MMNYKTILKLKWPMLPIVRFNNDTYEGIVWNTSKAIPTKAELDAAIAQYTNSEFVSPTGETFSNLKLADTGVVPGTYSKVTVDAAGRILGGTLISDADIASALGFTPENAAGQVDILSTYAGSTGTVSGTSQIPADNTIPLVTEGTQLWTQTVSPRGIASKFIIDQTFTISCSVNTRQVTLALFRDNNCIYVTSISAASAGKLQSAYLHVVDNPNTATAVVYSLRVGVNTGSTTWYINAAGASTYTFGGVANSSDWSILEIN